MRLNLLVLFLALSITASFGQAQGFKYQAVARDANGGIVANQTIGIRISIIQGNINNAPEFIEEHTPTSNDYGLINLEIGTGTAVLSTMGEVDWSVRSFMKVEMDISGGANYQDMGTTELFAVPKAMYAERAGAIDLNGFGLNVKDFGARGNNQDDDKAAFRQAIDSAAITGARVIVPAGVYKIGGTLTLPDGVSLVGEGAGKDPLQTPNNGSAIYYTGGGAAIKVAGHNAGVRDLVIVNRSEGNAKDGIRVVADGRLVESLRFHNVLISNFTDGTGLKLVSRNSGGIAYSSFYNIRVRNAKVGIRIHQDSSSFTNSNTFHHGAVSGGGYEHCLLVTGGNNNIFYGTVFEPYTSTKGHIVVKRGEIQGQNIRIEGVQQPDNIPLIEFKRNTKNSVLEGTYSGGTTLDRGNNFINFRSGKSVMYKNSDHNQFMNATFGGFSGGSLPYWSIVGNTSQVKVLSPQLTADHKTLKLVIPANTLVEFKPSGDAMPQVKNLPLHDQVNFGFYVKTNTPGIVYAKSNAPAGLTISQKHTGDNKWHFIGMNAAVDRTQPLNSGLFINNNTGSAVTVFVAAPTFTFGNQAPSIEAKPITTSGGVLNGALTSAMNTVNSIPANGFLVLPKDANYFEVDGTSTIYRINHSGTDRFAKGTVVTLLFANAGINVTSSAYLNLKGGFTSVANSSLTLISMGNGTWKEVNRNL